MSSEFTIQEFVKSSHGERIGRVEIRGKIVSCYESGLFKFADTSGCVMVKALPKFSGQIVLGKYVKLVNPEADSTGEKIIILGEKSVIFPARRIKELEDYEVKMQDSQDCPSLAVIGQLDPHQKVSEIQVLVLKDLGVNKAGQRKTPVRKLLVKDKEGTEAKISVWSHFIEQVHLDKIYRITNMRIEKFPDKKPHQISTTFTTKIIDITDEKKEEFKGVSLIAGTVHGHVEVFHGIYKYDCCYKCKCKVDATMIRCATCNVMLEEKLQTFKYILCLNLGNDEMFEITGFSPTIVHVAALDAPFPSNDDIEDHLNNALEKKHVEVEYTIKQTTNDKIVHKVTLLD